MRRFVLFILFTLLYFSLNAQENYEIQVYGSQTQSPRSAIFELHSNFAFDGLKEMEDGVFPSNHALHETVEITTGITPIFEIGAYLFTSYNPGHGYQVVGTHIRPRIMAPESWELPVGLSLSTEFGYQKAAYSADTWNIEIRPIIDKQWNKLYVSFNPTMGIALKSEFSTNSTPTFEPNLKMAYTCFKNGSLGFEYYGDTGYVNQPEKPSQQSHTLYLAYDMLNNPQWELNIGAGFGLNDATDPFLFKVILGRRVNW